MTKDDPYSCELPWDGKKVARTLVVHCSAFDFVPYFREFLEKGLKLGAYDLIAVPGGSQILVSSHFLPKVASYLRRLASFLVEAHKLQRVVVLGHEDCGFYKDFRFGPIHVDLRERQLKDLREAAKTLRELLKLPVDVWYARINDGKVEFEVVS